MIPHDQSESFVPEQDVQMHSDIILAVNTVKTIGKSGGSFRCQTSIADSAIGLELP